MNLDVVVIGAFLALVVWDSVRRWLNTRTARAVLLENELAALHTAFNDNAAALTTCVLSLESFTEKNRAIMKGFIDSMTDLVKLSEEDKQNLLNRVAASRLERKK